MREEWVCDAKGSEKIGPWRCRVEGKGYGFVSGYEDSDKIYYFVDRTEAKHHLDGLLQDRSAAIEKVEEALWLPIEDFNALVASKLRREIVRLEQQLLDVLPPGGKQSRDYSLGYTAGVADTKRKTREVLLQALEG